MPDSSEQVALAYEEALEVMKVHVKLDKDGKDEVYRIMEQTVGTMANDYGEVWSNARFHNFVLGQLAIIARDARNAAWDAAKVPPDKRRGRAHVDKSTLVNVVVATMNDTHSIFEDTKSNCAMMVVDGKAAGLPGDGTESGPICAVYLAAVILPS